MEGETNFSREFKIFFASRGSGLANSDKEQVFETFSSSPSSFFQANSIRTNALCEWIFEGKWFQFLLGFFCALPFATIKLKWKLKRKNFYYCLFFSEMIFPSQSESSERARESRARAWPCPLNSSQLRRMELFPPMQWNAGNNTKKPKQFNHSFSLEIEKNCIAQQQQQKTWRKFKIKLELWNGRTRRNHHHRTKATKFQIGRDQTETEPGSTNFQLFPFFFFFFLCCLFRFKWTFAAEEGGGEEKEKGNHFITKKSFFCSRQPFSHQLAELTTQGKQTLSNLWLFMRPWEF